MKRARAQILRKRALKERTINQECERAKNDAQSVERLATTTAAAAILSTDMCETRALAALASSNKRRARARLDQIVLFKIVLKNCVLDGSEHKSNIFSICKLLMVK